VRFVLNRIHVRAVNTVTTLRVAQRTNRVSKSGKGKKFFSSLKRPDQNWGKHQCFTRCLGLHQTFFPEIKRPQCEADWSTPHDAEVNNEWIYTSSSHTPLCCTNELLYPFYAPSHKCEKRPINLWCLSVRMEQLGSQWTYFHEIRYLSIFRKSIDKIQLSLKFDESKGYLTWRCMYVHDSISLSSV
jgi:hypothetical protein